ncbi:MAG TPA: hypothetical protein VKG25_19585 [Bryobacteraceae bacterium]|nr:hypothetical protein [Bryobacteraceae bacterium]
MPFFLIWSALALTVLGLAVYRKFLALHENEVVHLADGEARMIPQQSALAHKLDAIDRWGKPLTVLTLVFGLLIAAAEVYNVWGETSQLH